MGAAVTFQRIYRGIRGSIYAMEVKKEHMGRWREVQDNGATYYFNPVTAEVRYRKPQDLLNLLPRPTCDNCGEFEAQVECQRCQEYFCGQCWNQVHFGGKRKLHRFRSLYDYYARRIDYGDDEFPSLWPSDIEQDEYTGHFVRTDMTTDRQALSSDGPWQVYEIPSSSSLLYYNMETGEDR